MNCVRCDEPITEEQFDPETEEGPLCTECMENTGTTLDLGEDEEDYD